MTYTIYQNGFYLDENRAHLSLADRGFLAGEGVFETLRAYQGHVVFLEEHFKRLHDSAHVLGLKFPVSSARLKFLVDEMINMNKLSEAVVRIYISSEGASVGDLDSPPKQVNFIISCRPFENFPAEFYEEGVSTILVKDVYAESGVLAQIKSLNYLSRLLARRQARSQGAFEGILLNGEGRIAEGSGSNLFIVSKERVFTPPLEEGALPGVTRSQIFRIAEKEKIPLDEKPLTTEDLSGAEEIFLTSTLKEVMPVRSVDGKALPLKAPGPVTRLWMELYRDWVQWNVERYLSERSGLTDLS
jgi:branched-chain amino acid aminotransferase